MQKIAAGIMLALALACAAQERDEMTINKIDAGSQVKNGGGGGVVLSQKTVISAAQANNVLASPVPVVPAPAPGSVVVPIAAMLQFKFNVHNQFTGEDKDILIFPTGQPPSVLLTASSSGFLDQDRDMVAYMGIGYPAFEDAQFDPGAVSGVGLSLGGVQNFNLNGGQLIVTVYYVIVPLQ